MASCKYSYTRLVELSIVTPHCVGKFKPVFGELNWPSTWSQLFFLPLDHAVVDFSYYYCITTVFKHQEWLPNFISQWWLFWAAMHFILLSLFF